MHSLGEFGWKLGLERFAALCERLGDPQEKLRAVHIAGTNGKGSTAAMIAAILKSAGYRVGSYYSPYVYDIRERVQVNGEMIGKSDFARLVNVIRPHASALAETDLGHPTEFEVKTALGFLYFVEQGVDFAVLEVGLGGRLDATNVVNALVSVITNVTLDHMDRLGSTIPEIAAEKAGIIKQDGHVVTAAEGEALDIIRRTCEARNSILWHVRQVNGCNEFEIRPISTGEAFAGAVDVERQSCSLAKASPLRVNGVNSTYRDVNLRMKGDFQFINAATAVGAIEALQSKGFEVPESAIRSGLESAYLPGRLEVLREHPTLLIDGAHNLAGARSLARALKDCFNYDRLFLVIGVVVGHSVDDVVGVLAPMAHRFYATAPDSPRAASADEIARVAKAHCPDVRVVQSAAEACRKALRDAREDDVVCVTGSFYTIHEVPRPSGELADEV